MHTAVRRAVASGDVFSNERHLWALVVNASHRPVRPLKRGFGGKPQPWWSQ